MDRHGLLGICHKLNRAMYETQARRIAQAYEWKWECTAVVYPESRCTYCKSPIRSSLIWLLKDARLQTLVGQLYFTPDKKVKLLHIPHAHMLNSSTLCLGKNTTGIDLLSSEIYLNGTSMSTTRIPQWYKRYWNHDCQQMREFIINTYITIDRPVAGVTILKELDTPWSILSEWGE